MQIKSVGTCVDGTIRSTFDGGAATQIPDHKVIGGEFVGVFDPQVMDVAFGRWEMSVVNTTLQQDSSVFGFWQEIGEKQKPEVRTTDNQTIDIQTTAVQITEKKPVHTAVEESMKVGSIN
ncbi:MAG: hypothetical protein JKY24_08845 [Pseudomonadales bacterium]|nr:hypothetical protein [Pseudomonadales bacterium]